MPIVLFKSMMEFLIRDWSVLLGEYELEHLDTRSERIGREMIDFVLRAPPACADTDPGKELVTNRGLFFLSRNLDTSTREQVSSPAQSFDIGDCDGIGFIQGGGAAKINRNLENNRSDP